MNWERDAVTDCPCGDYRGLVAKHGEFLTQEYYTRRNGNVIGNEGDGDMAGRMLREMWLTKR